MPKPDFFRNIKDLANSISQNPFSLNSTKSDAGKTTIPIDVSSDTDKNILILEFEGKTFSINYQDGKIFDQNKSEVVSKRTIEEIEYIAQKAYSHNKTVKAAEWRATVLELERDLAAQNEAERRATEEDRRRTEEIARELRRVMNDVNIGAASAAANSRAASAAASAADDNFRDWEDIVAGVALAGIDDDVGGDFEEVSHNDADSKQQETHPNAPPPYQERQDKRPSDKPSGAKNAAIGSGRWF